jgi:hypothetical protein
MRDKPRRLPWRHCSTVWNGCVCARDAHNDDRHVWFNTLDGTMVDPARYPARVAAPSDGLREALAEAEGVLTDGWALRLTSRPTAGYRAEALYNDKVKVYVVAATPDGALRELSDVITESHVND